MRALLVMGVMALGCQSTKEIWEPDPGSISPRVTGTAELLEQSLHVVDGQLAVHIIDESGRLPRRSRNDVAGGRAWLVLEEPADRAFAVRGLLAEAEAVTVVFVRTKIPEGVWDRPRVHVRLEGLRRDWAMPVASPPDTAEREMLDVLPDAKDRVAYGRAMDSIMAIEGVTESETVEWVAVVDAAGAPVPDEAWMGRLAEAEHRDTLATLGDRFAVIRRDRPSQAARYYLVSFESLFIATQLRLREDRWMWDGEWAGRLSTVSAGARVVREDATVQCVERKLEHRYGGVGGVALRVLATVGSGFVDALSEGCEEMSDFEKAHEEYRETARHRRRHR